MYKVTMIILAAVWMLGCGKIEGPFIEDYVPEPVIFEEPTPEPTTPEPSTPAPVVCDPCAPPYQDVRGPVRKFHVALVYNQEAPEVVLDGVSVGQQAEVVFSDKEGETSGRVAVVSSKDHFQLGKVFPTLKRGLGTGWNWSADYDRGDEKQYDLIVLIPSVDNQRFCFDTLATF